METEGSRDNALIKERRDEEFAKIHAKEELQQMIAVWEQIEGGVSKISKGEAAWLKRKGIRSEEESATKQKTTEERDNEGIGRLQGWEAAQQVTNSLWTC
nr:hypothetical protein [Tanacetum cinerariifolium]